MVAQLVRHSVDLRDSWTVDSMVAPKEWQKAAWMVGKLVEQMVEMKVARLVASTALR